ncbi:MAG: class A sortase [Clostridiaceae bacterium]
MAKKIIAVLIILVALLLIFSNQISNYYIKSQSEKLTQNAIKEVTAEDIKKNTENTSTTEDMWDFGQVKALSVDQTFEQLQMSMRKASYNNSKNSNSTETSRSDYYTQDYIIGILRIPSVNLEMAVLRGVLNDNLLLGAGTLRYDQSLGTGNYPIAGHYSAYDGVLFNRVIDLGAGTMMYITDKTNIYAYKVYDNIVVDETDSHLIEDQVAYDAGGPVLSLMTCYYSGTSGKRVFVQGILQSVTPYTWDKFISLY